MADPLSIAASIAGLLSAGKEIIGLLWRVSSTIAEADSAVKSAVDEVKGTGVILRQLQVFLNGRRDASLRRREMITIEQITATLTGCVLAYSDLSTLLSQLNSSIILARMKWGLRKEKVDSLTRQLANYKIGFSLMLNILQCDALNEAETNMHSLTNTVSQLLDSQKDIAARIRNIEIGGTTTPTPATSSDGILLENTLLPSTEPRDVTGMKTRQFIAEIEEILSKSRAYRRIREDETSSLDRDARNSLIFSLGSSIALSDISSVAVFAIPVYAVELSNARHYTRQEAITGPDGDIDDATSSSTSPAPKAAPKADDIRSNAGSLHSYHSDLLERALASAHRAVLFDDDGKLDEAMAAYKEALVYLTMILRDTIDAPDKRQLNAIRLTYRDRIVELRASMPESAHDRDDLTEAFEDLDLQMRYEHDETATAAPDQRRRFDTTPSKGVSIASERQGALENLSRIHSNLLTSFDRIRCICPTSITSHEVTEVTQGCLDRTQEFVDQLFTLCGHDIDKKDTIEDIEKRMKEAIASLVDSLQEAFDVCLDPDELANFDHRLAISNAAIKCMRVSGEGISEGSQILRKIIGVGIESQPGYASSSGSSTQG